MGLIALPRWFMAPARSILPISAALLRRGGQGPTLATDQAGHRHRAPARLDQRYSRGKIIRCRLSRPERYRPARTRRLYRALHTGMGLSRDWLRA